MSIAGITQHNVTMPAGSSETKVFEQNRAQFTYELKAVEIGRFCRGKPRNFANWPAEFGKIYRRKLWVIIIALAVQISIYAMSFFSLQP